MPAQVLTDNGAVFTGNSAVEGRVALEIQLGLPGVRLGHSRPYHPQTCGKVERFHQTQKKWLAAQPRRGDRGRAATPAGPVRPLLQHRPAPPSVGRRTPAQAYAGRPKAVPTGPVIPAHYRVRTDKIDSGGCVTVRHNSRLHHIGLGARLAGTPISLLIDDLHIRVIHRHTGPLIRELILDPTRDYQPRGLPPDHPKRRGHTPPGIPIPAKHAARSRSQGWPQATRRAPALTPARTAPPSPAGMPKQPQKCNDVPRHLLNGVPRHHIGAPSRIRTYDTRFRKPLLYPLSYGG